jgi:hypothetical protein
VVLYEQFFRRLRDVGERDLVYTLLMQADSLATADASQPTVLRALLERCKRKSKRKRRRRKKKRKRRIEVREYSFSESLVLRYVLESVADVVHLAHAARPGGKRRVGRGATRRLRSA